MMMKSTFSFKHFGLSALMSLIYITSTIGMESPSPKDKIESLTSIAQSFLFSPLAFQLDKEYEIPSYLGEEANLKTIPWYQLQFPNEVEQLNFNRLVHIGVNSFLNDLMVNLKNMDEEKRKNLFCLYNKIANITQEIFEKGKKPGQFSQVTGFDWFEEKCHQPLIPLFKFFSEYARGNVVVENSAYSHGLSGSVVMSVCPKITMKGKAQTYLDQYISSIDFLFKKSSSDFSTEYGLHTYVMGNWTVLNNYGLYGDGIRYSYKSRNYVIDTGGYMSRHIPYICDRNPTWPIHPTFKQLYKDQLAYRLEKKQSCPEDAKIYLQLAEEWMDPELASLALSIREEGFNPCSDSGENKSGIYSDEDMFERYLKHELILKALFASSQFDRLLSFIDHDNKYNYSINDHFYKEESHDHSIPWPIVHDWRKGEGRCVLIRKRYKIWTYMALGMENSEKRDLAQNLIVQLPIFNHSFKPNHFTLDQLYQLCLCYVGNEGYSRTIDLFNTFLATYENKLEQEPFAYFLWCYHKLERSKEVDTLKEHYFKKYGSIQLFCHFDHFDRDHKVIFGVR